MKTHPRRVQKIQAMEIEERRREDERDHWFNQEWHVIPSKKTWKEKRIEKEKRSDGSGDDEVGTVSMDVNMVFHLPDEFGLLELELAQLALGAERVVFKKLEEVGSHMKPLYIRGYLDGELINRMLVDGDACVNIMSCSVFERLGIRRRSLWEQTWHWVGFLGKQEILKE
jgi:hypothetical protein